MAKAEPNVVPLCDVLLVLLIIFMVITPLVQKGIDIKLPETSDASSGGQPTGLIVMTLKAVDVVDINGTPTEIRGLLEELRRVYSTRQDKTIFIRAYAHLSVASVMEIIDIARGAGVETLALVPEYIIEE